MTETQTDTEILLRKKLDREKRAREQAEDLLESKSLELYMANKSVNEAAQKAKNNTARMNAIMNSMQDSVIATDLSLKVIDANQASISLFGRNFNEMKEYNLLNSIPIKLYQDYLDMCESVKNEEVEIHQVAFELIVGENNTIPVDVSVTSFKHDDELFLLHLFRDVSRRKEMEQERKKMQDDLAHAAKWEAVGQLAGGIAHEINTPSQYIGDNLNFLSTSATELFSILEKALTLKAACADTGDHAEMVSAVDEAIEEFDLSYLIEEMPLAFKQSRDGIAQVSRIVLAMKNFSHPGTNDKEPVDFNQAIDTTLTVSRNEWKDVAHVEKKFDDSLGTVSCIPGAMNQVLLNIIVNAAQAIEEAKRPDLGTITLTTQKSGDWVDFTISDTGTGIPEEHHANIFNPFFTTKDVGKGTGQGLSIVHDIIVDKHNGSISFDTENGVGTTFKIRLPIAG